jgi:hypothetical protein
VYRWKRYPPRPQLLAPSDGHTAAVAAIQNWSIGQREFAHRRELIPNERGLSIVDDVYAAPANRAVVRLGLSPGASITLGSQVIVRTESAAVQVQVTRNGVDSLRQVDSWYAPRYGVGLDAQALEADCTVTGWTRIVTHVHVLDGILPKGSPAQIVL